MRDTLLLGAFIFAPGTTACLLCWWMTDEAWLLAFAASGPIATLGVALLNRGESAQ